MGQLYEYIPKNHYKKELVMFKLVVALSALSLIAGTSLIQARSMESNSSSSQGIREIGSAGDMENTLANNQRVVALFYDPGCGACQAFLRTGVFQNAAASNNDVTFVRISVHSGDAFSRYAKNGRVPSIGFYSNGQRVDDFQGGIGSEEMQSRVRSLKSR